MFRLLFLFVAFVIFVVFTGCEAIATVGTAPICVAEGAKESWDRKQTEKQEGHPYGLTDLAPERK